MVDVGLPWWVVTAIAVGVVLISAAVALRASARFVRGVATTLAVQGVAIAILAPLLMSDRGSLEGALTREEYAARADAQCEEFGERSENLGLAEELPQLAVEMEQLVPMFWESYGYMGTLVPPDEEMGTAMAWMNRMAMAGEEFEAMRDGARAGDDTAVGAANERFEVVAAETTELSKELGMTACWQ